MRKKLVQLGNNEQGEISSVEGGVTAKEKLETLGIRPGKKVRKVSSQAFRGPVVINIDGRNIAMGHGLAQKVIIDSNN